MLTGQEGQNVVPAAKVGHHCGELFGECLHTGDLHGVG
jgi:hypothetical protein